MKKVKYNLVGTEAKRFGEYANQCKDEHEAEINRAIEHYGLDKEVFYTNEQKRAAAEFTIKREIKAKAIQLVEVLAGGRMSDKEMKKSLESKKQRKVTNSENAKKPRKKDKPTKEELEKFRNEWCYEHGHDYGWKKAAIAKYACSRKTINSIYKEEK